MIMQFASRGDLRNILSSNFKNILWNEKIDYLYLMAKDLKNLHELGYFHKDFHSGNMLSCDDDSFYISDFGLSGPSNEQKLSDSSNKIPINSSFIATTYLNEEDNKDCQDSQLIDLEIPSTSKLEDGDSDN
ncbi:kinase-like domain-containing protein [Rhizophagus irregularis DAOM 181602=DAOM 197198]|nr:kinase-like domain-containing protein [Rhizophagus irregularis DAOM 181602=DAOM 197198]